MVNSGGILHNISWCVVCCSWWDGWMDVSIVLSGPGETSGVLIKIWEHQKPGQNMVWLSDGWYPDPATLTFLHNRLVHSRSESRTEVLMTALLWHRSRHLKPPRGLWDEIPPTISCHHCVLMVSMNGKNLLKMPIKTQKKLVDFFGCLEWTSSHQQPWL